MTLALLEMPDDFPQRAVWLDQQIVGLELRSLVQRIESTRESKAQLDADQRWESRLRLILGDRLPSVLGHGLASIDEKRLEQLLQQPRTLLALQEIVLLEGGEYWRSLPLTEQHQSAAVRVEQQVFQAISREKGQRNSLFNDWGSKNRRQLVAVGLALAACLLVMFVLFPGRNSSGKFFARPGLLDSKLQGGEFMLSLSQAISEDWSDPGGGSLQHKLRTLASSCNQLINAKLDQIDPAKAADLRDRCKKWQAAFTQQLKDLDEGRSEEEIRKSSEQTVSKLIDYLKTA